MNRWARWLQVNGPGRFQLASKAGWDAFVNTAAREPLEQLTRAEMSRLGDEELEDYTEARMVWNANLPTVKTHQLPAAFEVIDQVMASNRRDADRLRGSVVIDAAPGLGKTTIATRYARDFHRRTYRRHGPKTAAGHQRLPVAFIPLSAGITHLLQRPPQPRRAQARTCPDRGQRRRPKTLGPHSPHGAGLRRAPSLSRRPRAQDRRRMRPHASRAVAGD